VAAALGLALGVACARARTHGPAPARVLAGAYVELIRNTPFIVQLFFIFFGLPSLGVRLNSETASIIAMTLNLGAYASEIIRAGIESIPKSQVEAAVALGLTGRQVFRHIILVPALKNVYPSLTSQFILLMLATSVASQIAAPELFYAGSIIQSRTYRDFEVYTVIAVAYLVLALLLRIVFAFCYRLLVRRR